MPGQTITRKFVYRIESRPEGGFIARPNDPAIGTVEADTREELQQKIEARMNDVLKKQLDTFKFGRFDLLGNANTASQASEDLPPGEPVNGPVPIEPAAGNRLFLPLMIGLMLILAGVYYFLHR
jgi:hypothetical protein